MLPNAVRSSRKVSKAVRSCQRYPRCIPEVSQFRSRGITFSMKFYSDVSQKYPSYPRGIPPGIQVSLQRNFKKIYLFNKMLKIDGCRTLSRIQKLSRGCPEAVRGCHRLSKGLSEAVGSCRRLSEVSQRYPRGCQRLSEAARRLRTLSGQRLGSV